MLCFKTLSYPSRLHGTFYFWCFLIPIKCSLSMIQRESEFTAKKIKINGRSRSLDAAAGFWRKQVLKLGIQIVILILHSPPTPNTFRCTGKCSLLRSLSPFIPTGSCTLSWNASISNLHFSFLTSEPPSHPFSILVHQHKPY